MKTIVVLGMHRSGTSLLSRMLIQAGVDMGSYLLDGDDRNPDGYYEDMDFLDLNKSILKSAGGSWYNPPEINQIAKVKPLYDDKISKLIRFRQHDKKKNDLWGWKDPRNCLTISLYAKYLDNPRFVVIYRDPDAIIRSILRFWDGDTVKWRQVIESYNHSIGWFLRKNSYPYWEVFYEDLVSRRKFPGVVATLADFIGLGREAFSRASKFVRYN